MRGKGLTVETWKPKNQIELGGNRARIENLTVREDEIVDGRFGCRHQGPRIDEYRKSLV